MAVKYLAVWSTIQPDIGLDSQKTYDNLCTSLFPSRQFTKKNALADFTMLSFKLSNNVSVSTHLVGYFLCM